MIASAPSSGADGRMPFAGRESELAALDRAAGEAGRGEPRIVIVEGRAGMGKSALLGEFARRLPDGATLVRVAGAEPESGLPYWLVGQILSAPAAPAAPGALGALGAPGGTTGPRSAGAGLSDPLAAGAKLAGELSRATAGGRLVVLVIDDLHWADPESASAVLHALRRMHSGALLVVAAVRPREFGWLAGGGWSRFAAGDHRATRLRLDGLGVADVRALALAVGLADLPENSAAKLVENTEGRPGLCRAILAGSSQRPGDGPLFRPLSGELTRIPLEIADQISGCAGNLTPEARDLLEAAAVLGFSCSLGDAAGIGDLADPSKALAEVAGTSLLAESPVGLSGQVQFADPISQLAVYRQMGVARRRELHQKAAELSSPEQRLRHLFAAASGPDAGLAAEFERAAGRATADRGMTGAGADSVMATRTAGLWLVQAATLAADRADRDRLVLDAADVLLRSGDATAAGEIAAMVAQAEPASRRDVLLGWLDLLAGRFMQAEEQFTAARRAGQAGLDLSGYVHATVGLLWCLLYAGRFDEAVLLSQEAMAAAGRLGSPGQDRKPGGPRSHTDVHRGHENLAYDTEAQWSGRTLTWADGAGDVAIALACAGRRAEAMACFGSLPAGAGETPLGATGALAARGIVRVIAGAFEAAVTDLSVVAGRLESGRAVRLGGLAMGFLAEAEYQLGDWSAAARHAELAIGLTGESGRRGELSLVHAFAALVPVGQGDWEAAAGHVEAAGKAARSSGTALGMAAWASARAGLALARGDDELALRATQAVRDTGREEALSGLGFYPWSLQEAEALIELGRADEARARLKASGYRAPDMDASGQIRPPHGEASPEPGSRPAGSGDTGPRQPGAPPLEGRADPEPVSAGGHGTPPRVREALDGQGGHGAPATGRRVVDEHAAQEAPAGMRGVLDGHGGLEPPAGMGGVLDARVGLEAPGGVRGIREELSSGRAAPRADSDMSPIELGGCEREVGGSLRVTEELVALRLYGLLAAGGGDAAGAAAMFAAGRDDPRAAAVPYQLARLELAAGRGLRLVAQRPEAIAWLREARGRLVRLRAAPAVGACDQELAACGVQTGREVSAATLGLTPTELAVASLVAAGRSNRQAAAELYVSIKGIEFHLRNIFAKLGIRSRKDLADRLGDDADVMTLA